MNSTILVLLQDFVADRHGGFPLNEGKYFEQIHVLAVGIEEMEICPSDLGGVGVQGLFVHQPRLQGNTFVGLAGIVPIVQHP